jgi:hypothetical protein
MVSSIHQRRSEEIKRVHVALTNGVNPLSREEAHLVETCCRKLGMNYPERHSK